MQYFLERLGRSILPICLLIVVSGCEVFLPTPSHRETLEINPTITNPQLTDRLLGVLSENGIAPCNGMGPKDPNLPACSTSWWQGSLTKIDRDAGVIEVGDFPVYQNHTVGHSARFRRVSDNTLEITVKGAGFYYSPLPNENVARELVAIIENNF